VPSFFIIYVLPRDSSFVVENAEALIHLLGCEKKAWVTASGNGSERTHTFHVPNAKTGTDTDTAQVKKPPGEKTERAERIFEMMCYSLLAGIQYDKKKKGSSGSYDCVCSKCNVRLFRATVKEYKFSFSYLKHSKVDCSAGIDWMHEEAHKLLVPTPDFCTALVGAVAFSQPGATLSDLRVPLQQVGFNFDFKLLKKGYERFLLLEPKLDKNEIANTGTSTILSIFKSAFKNKSENASKAVNKKKNKPGAELNSSENVARGTGHDASVQTGKRKRPSTSRIPQPDEAAPLIRSAGEAGHAAMVDATPAHDHAPPASARMPAPDGSVDIAPEQQTRYYTEEVDVLAHANEADEADEGMLPSPPVVEPTTTQAKWSFCDISRVMRVDFTEVEVVSDTEKLLFATWLQRDDVTIVSRGLLKDVNDPVFSTAFAKKNYVKNAAETTYFKIFDRVQIKDADGKPYHTFEERNGRVKMEMPEFAKYIEHRQRVLCSNGSNEKDESKTMTIIVNDVETKINVAETTIYMLDCPMATELVPLFNAFNAGIKIPEMLPAGSWCMTHIVRFHANLP
jgi:hypothetical protein